jgi:hypothetical protein
MVRYRVKAGQTAENERLIGQVYEQLQREAPPGLHYATFKLPDGVTFIHVASVDAPGGKHPLTPLSAFQAFTANIAERCDEPPVTTELSLIGAYRAFGV